MNTNPSLESFGHRIMSSALTGGANSDRPIGYHRPEKISSIETTDQSKTSGIQFRE